MQNGKTTQSQPLHTSALCLPAGWERQAAERSRAGTTHCRTVCMLSSHASSTQPLTEASPLCCGPSVLAAPAQQRQSLGSLQLSASEAMVDQHRHPTVPSSWVLPQPQVEGRTEQAHVCRHRQARGGGRRKQKQSRNSRVEGEPTPGEEGWRGQRWRDGCAELPPG